MTCDEVICFTQFHYEKGDDEEENKKCKMNFHSSFIHPEAPNDVEPRRSCEYRCQVYLRKPD